MPWYPLISTARIPAFVSMVQFAPTVLGPDRIYLEVSPEVSQPDFTLATMPERYAAVGDRHAGIDDAAGSLDTLTRSKEATLRRRSF